MNTLTIQFRAKRQHFSGGDGYQVPRLQAHHVTFAEHDTTAVTVTTARDLDAAVSRYLELPGVVWAADTETGDSHRDTTGWTVKPIGKGFMADVSITVPVVKRPH